MQISNRMAYLAEAAQNMLRGTPEQLHLTHIAFDKWKDAKGETWIKEKENTFRKSTSGGFHKIVKFAGGDGTEVYVNPAPKEIQRMRKESAAKKNYGSISMFVLENGNIVVWPTSMSSAHRDIAKHFDLSFGKAIPISITTEGKIFFTGDMERMAKAFGSKEHFETTMEQFVKKNKNIHSAVGEINFDKDDYNYMMGKIGN